MSFGEFWRSKVLQAQRQSPPLLLPVVAIHAFVTAFSITGNQRRYYYDSIQCALMVGGNLLLITPSRSLIYCQPPFPCHAAISCLRGGELAWKMEGEENQEARGEMEIGECTFGWIRRQPPSSGAFRCEWVFSRHNVVFKTRKRRNIWERKRVKYVCCT